VGAFGTDIWVGKRPLQYRLSAGNGPQNYANFSHRILGFTLYIPNYKPYQQKPQIIAQYDVIDTWQIE
jgi:hypothetical protein